LPVYYQCIANALTVFTVHYQYTLKPCFEWSYFTGNLPRGIAPLVGGLLLAIAVSWVVGNLVKNLYLLLPGSLIFARYLR